MIRYVDEEAIATAQKAYARMDSEGQRRMSQLHNGSREALEVSPNLWAGVGLVRGGAGIALVGDPDTGSANVRVYRFRYRCIYSLWLSTFRRGVSGSRIVISPFATRASTSNRATARISPFGEIVANDNFPKQKAVTTVD